MDKFIIEVSNELDSEYIQRKAFEAGYAWNNVDGLVSFLPKYINFNWHQDKGLTHGTSTGAPCYSFPSQASEIVKLFDKKSEFKDGDWVVLIKSEHGFNHTSPKLNAGDIFKVLSIEQSNIKGVDYWLNAQQHGCGVPKNHCRLATSQEIETHLISEAEKKGFVKGAKVKYNSKAYSYPNDKVYVIDRFELCPESKELKVIYADKKGQDSCKRLNEACKRLRELPEFENPVESFRSRVIAELEGMKIDDQDICTMERASYINPFIDEEIERIKNLK